jgi:hypothetical protein
MQQTDRERFIRAFAVMTEVFKEDVSDLRTEAYFSVLSDYPIEQVEAGIKQAMRCCKFFPRPAEIVEQMGGGTIQDKAENAWTLFLDCLRVVGHYNSLWVEDGFFSYALDATFGGWLPATTQMHELSDEMVASKRKQFVSAYRIAQNQQRLGRQNYFQGQHEATNRSTASSWKRGNFPNGVFTQQVGILSGDRVALLPLEFSGITGELMDGAMRMLKSGAYAQALTAHDERKRVGGTRQKQLPEATEPLSLDEAIDSADDDLQKRRLENLQRRLTGEVKGFQ